MTIDQAYQILYSTALLIIAILIGIMIVRSIKGPQITDRLLSVNMINTMVIIAFLILAALLKENYLADVALIYALISFVSTLVFASVYVHKIEGEKDGGKDSAGNTVKESLGEKVMETAVDKTKGKED